MPSSSPTDVRSSDPGPASSATRHLEVIRRGIGSDRPVAEILGVAPGQVAEVVGAVEAMKAGVFA